MEICRGRYRGDVGEIVAQQHDAHVRCAPASGATHPPSIRPSTRLYPPAPSYQCPEAEGIPPRRRPGRYLYSVHLKPLTGVKALAWLGVGVGLRLG